MISLALSCLQDDDGAVREAALRALAPLTGASDAQALVAAVKAAKSTGERSASEKALIALCARAGAEVEPVVIAGLKGADPEAQVVLLDALGRIGGSKALDVVLAAMVGDEAGVRTDAVRVLSDWTTLDAAPHLLKLAQSDTLRNQVLGLRGYVHHLII